MSTAILNMSQSQVTKLQSHMIDVCLAYELGGDYKLVARRARQTALGQTKKSLELIENADAAAIGRLAEALIT